MAFSVLYMLRTENTLPSMLSRAEYQILMRATRYVLESESPSASGLFAIFCGLKPTLGRRIHMNKTIRAIYDAMICEVKKTYVEEKEVNGTSGWASARADADQSSTCSTVR